MSERRGRRIYLILASITVLVKLGGLFPILDEHFTRFGKILPVVIAVSVIFLWRGSDWIQRLAGWAFIVSGALTLVRFARSLDSLDVHGVSVVFSLLLGLVDFVAGVAILRMPALNAFFRHQRDGNHDLKAPIQERRILAACFWGLVLSSGAAFLLAMKWAESIEFGVGFPGEFLSILGGIGAFTVLGVIAGLAVGFVGPGPEVGTSRRSVITRGLVAAGACVVAGVIGAAIYGGLFGEASSDFPADPGWPRAGLWAVIWLFLGSPMLAAAGMALGVPIALLIRENEKD